MLVLLLDYMPTLGELYVMLPMIANVFTLNCLLVLVMCPSSSIRKGTR